MSKMTTREIAQEEASKVEDEILEILARRRERMEAVEKQLQRVMRQIEQMDERMKKMMMYLEVASVDPQIDDKLNRIESKNDG